MNINYSEISRNGNGKRRIFLIAIKLNDLIIYSNEANYNKQYD
jgi:hypothetical protein